MYFLSEKCNFNLITQGVLRVVLLGDSSVGKTAFLNRYLKVENEAIQLGIK